MYDLLQDLTVVEGASFIAGPSCALHLAQMGARVIRFDMIGGGPDFYRWPHNARGDSLYWEGLNKGKLSVALDLRRPEGRELAVALVTAPDEGRGLFVTNFPVEGFLSHTALSARRPDLISLRVQGWPDGRNGVDYSVNATVGVPFMTGPEDLPADVPVNSALPAWDLLAGAYGAFSLLAAERRRRTTGQGAELRLALSDLAIGSLAHLGQVAEVSLGGERARYGNAIFGAFGRDFVTSDGKSLIIVAITPRQWAGLLEALKITAAVATLQAELGVRFDTDEGERFRHRGRLADLIASAVLQRMAGELIVELEAAGVCWEPYQTLREGVENDRRLVRDNGIFASVTHPGGDTYPTPLAMGRLIGEAAGLAPRAPKLGEHTAEVLECVLGLSGAALGRLFDEGLIAGPR
jgi:2-methylfumaryl-CoA isomerase